MGAETAHTGCTGVGHSTCKVLLSVHTLGCLASHGQHSVRPGRKVGDVVDDLTLELTHHYYSWR